jgi:hypothetical protein
MSEYDFLNTLKEDLPPDFAQELKAKLDAMDTHKSAAPPTHRTFWTVAAASIVTLLLGIVLVINRMPQLLTLVIAPLTPVLSFTQHGEITTESIDQLQPFARLGNGAMTGMHMLPDSEHLLVTATTGLYLHDAHDLSAEPQQIYEGSIANYSDVDAQGNLYGLAESIYTQRENPVTIARWNTTTGERTDILHLNDLTLYAIEDVQVNPDGSQILLSVCLEFTPMGFGSVCKQRGYRWYDALTGEHLNTIALPDTDIFWRSDVINDDWSYIAYQIDAAENETLSQPMIQLMNVATRETHTVISFGAPLSTEWGANVNVDRVEFSPDGQSLLTRSSNNGQHMMYAIYDVDSLWETETPINPGMDVDAVRYRVTTFAYSYHSLYFSPDNHYVLSMNDHQVLQYDITTGERNSQPIRSVIVSEDYSLNPHDLPIFSPDGSTLYIRYQPNIVIAYDTETLNKIDETAYFQNDSIDTFQFTQDGSQVAIYSGSGGIPNIWTINTDPPTHELFLPDGVLASIGRFILSPDGNTVVYKKQNIWETDDSLWIHQRENSTPSLPLPVDHYLMELQFLNDGTLLGIGMDNDTGELSLLRWSNDMLAGIIPDAQADELPFQGIGSMSLMWGPGSNNFAVDPNGHFFALSPCRLNYPDCVRDKFKVWNLQTDEQITVEDTQNFHVYGSMAFSPDNQLFAYGYCAEPFSSVDYFQNCDAGEVRFYTLDALFNTDTPMPLFTLTEFEALPKNIAFNPIQQSDGSWLVAITEAYTQTQLWRVHSDGTNELLRTLDALRQPVTFDPTGSLMFTTTDTAQTEVWGVPVASR